MTRQNEGYQHYADLCSRGNPPAAPDGALFRSADADRAPWCVVSKRGLDCYFHTMREAQDYISERGYRFVGPVKRGR